MERSSPVLEGRKSASYVFMKHVCPNLITCHTMRPVLFKHFQRTDIGNLISFSSSFPSMLAPETCAQLTVAHLQIAPSPPRDPQASSVDFEACVLKGQSNRESRNLGGNRPTTLPSGLASSLWISVAFPRGASPSACHRRYLAHDPASPFCLPIGRYRRRRHSLPSSVPGYRSIQTSSWGRWSGHPPDQTHMSRYWDLHRMAIGVSQTGAASLDLL
jgi:hypothetical protein